MIIETEDIKKVQDENGVNYWELVFEGQSLSISKWARFKKMSKQTLKMRLGRGWSVKKALSTEVKALDRLITYGGVTQNLISWAETLTIPYSVLKVRLHRGWSIEKTFTQPVQKRRKIINQVPKKIRLYTNPRKGGIMDCKPWLKNNKPIT